jgi:hypothetical protein
MSTTSLLWQGILLDSFITIKPHGRAFVMLSTWDVYKHSFSCHNWDCTVVLYNYTVVFSSSGLRKKGWSCLSSKQVQPHGARLSSKQVHMYISEIIFNYFKGMVVLYIDMVVLTYKLKGTVVCIRNTTVQEYIVMF